jgi:hypothetical protein
MATVDFPTLVNTQYIVAGAYIGQLIQPSPGATPNTRIPAYVGRGSRFAVARNQPVRRAFVLDRSVTFSSQSPYLAPLPFAASPDKAVARLVRSDGNEVKLNQWAFVQSVPGGEYDQILINTESYDPTVQYEVSYQSVDRTVLDPFPVSEIREFLAVGNGPDAPDYTEYQDYFADYTVTTPVGDPLNQNLSTALSAIVGDPLNATSLGVLSHATSSTFNHQYNRFYTIRVVSVGSGTATFEWSAQATSSGNANLPAVPLDSSLPKPTFTLAATAATGSITVVPGANLIDGETFTLNDGTNTPTVFEFNSTGGVGAGHVPVAFTVLDTAATVKAAVIAAINGVIGTLTITASSGSLSVVTLTNDSTGTLGNQTITETVADPGFHVSGMSGGVATSAEFPLELGLVVKANIAAGNFVAGNKYTFNAMGPALIEVDERLSNANQFHEQQAVTKTAGLGYGTFDYAATSNPGNLYNALYRMTVTSAADTSTKAVTQWRRDTAGIDLTAKIGGVAGNSITFSFVNSGIPNTPLAVASTATSLTVTLGTDAQGTPVSTIAQVVAAINAWPTSPVTAAAAGDDTPVVLPLTNSTADVLNGSTAVSNGVGVAFTTEMFAGSKIKFSNDPGHTYTVASRTGTGIVLTSSFQGATVAAGSNLTGTAAVTQGSVTVTGTLTQFISEAPAGTRLKFSSDPNHVYVVAVVTSNTVLTLTTPFLAADDASSTFQVPGVDITVVQDPLGKSTAGVNGLFSGTLAWAEYGERTGISGTQSFSFDQAAPADIVVPVSNGVVMHLDLSTGPMAAGDSFDWKVLAPREFLLSRDNRTISFETTTIPASGSPGFGHVSGTYSSNTPEGGFGLWTATDNSYVANSTGWQHGRFVLAGNILLAARNMHGGPTTQYNTAFNRHAVGNKFTMSATTNGTINWSLIAKTSETIAKSSVLTDMNGNVTGTQGTPYLFLANVPDEILTVVTSPGGQAVTYTLVTDTRGNNTQYLALAAVPTTDLKVTYLYRGAEPAPGQIYYVTTKHVRPAEMYNTPILLRSLDEVNRVLAPAEITNHLLIMAQIAIGDVGCPAVYVTQARDLDDDGVLTDVDFRDALIATEAPKAISDVIVLSHFSSLRDWLNQLDKLSDPFKRRFRLGFIGTPDGTPVGSDDEPGSLVYLAKKTLQVYGNNPAHGTRTLVAPTWATRDITLENRVTVEVRLDGSFVAGALAALVASFTDSSTTVLRKNLPGFKQVQTYGDVEAPTNLVLGASNVIFLSDQGGGVFRVEEDVTVDTFAPDFNLLNNMTQKMDVTKYVTDQLDSKVIGLVVPSEEAGVGLIRGFMVEALTTLLGQGRIARYQNDDGTERALDPNADIVVFRDSTDPTKWHLLYTYFLRNSIKRILGLYTVNGAAFASGA